MFLQLNRRETLSNRMDTVLSASFIDHTYEYACFIYGQEC